MGNLGKRDSIRVFILDTVQEQDHFHQDAELLYILEGSMNINVNRHTLKLNKEDVLMVNANETYQYQATDDIHSLSGKKMEDYRAGRLKLAEHELIEE